jgi:hypothetical protein
MTASSFTTAAGHRAGVPKIAIVVTDGRSNNPGDTLAAAEAARQSGTSCGLLVLLPRNVLNLFIQHDQGFCHGCRILQLRNLPNLSLRMCTVLIISNNTTTARSAYFKMFNKDRYIDALLTLNYILAS